MNAELASVTHDGFTVDSNTETPEQQRTSLGMPEKPDVGDPGDETPELATGGKEPKSDEKPAPTPVEAPKPDSEAGKQLAKKRNSLQDRIDELTRERHDSKREADAAKARAADLQVRLDALEKPKPAPETRVEPSKAESGLAEGEPDPAKYDAGEYDPKYIRDLTRFEAHQAVKARREQDEQERGAQDLQSRVLSMRERGNKDFDDFDSAMMAMEAAGIRLSEPARAAVLCEPLGHRLAYELATNLTLAQKVSSLSNPVAAGVEIGRILSRLEAATSGPASDDTTSHAKPPVKPVGSSPQTNDDPPDPSDFDAHVAYWNRKDREGKKGRR